MNQCKSITCDTTINDDQDFCIVCRESHSSIAYTPPQSIGINYPGFYKDVSSYSELDVYAIHQMFNIQDSSGCIQSASKRLLMSAVNKDKQAAISNITKARDTLTRWLELNSEDAS